ncbi:MAG: LytTR family transcriptional regulator DNA-binding domain-containing protein [Melioribacteraceae bacterium]|nr:LytTR family transcriptional regulator DNA-binding domain-containing protein [Melioribacteraceae bacterium]MCO6473419.1 response regulator [Melioribacteraceae bacterium]MDD3557525.1 LytTR family transcriptional regulator DNA-binding domain-containing protein [Melioribacteraceae bacterium]
MEKIKVVVIDDERLARDILKNYIHEHPQLEIIAECQNGFEGIKVINEQKPDLIFLDIQMPKITGFEMLELIDDPPFVIFTTAYDQYAIKAFEVNAVDYLLKPFAYDRFDEALNKALEKIKSNSQAVETITAIDKAMDETVEFLERIVVKDKQNISIIPVSDIIYLEAQSDYVQIVSRQGKFLKQKTMKFFEKHLNPQNFVRIHRSYISSISNIKQLQLLEKETYKATLTTGEKLPVSKTGYSKLRQLLDQ